MKRLFFYALLMLTAATTVVSCSKDDDNTTNNSGSESGKESTEESISTTTSVAVNDLNFSGNGYVTVAFGYVKAPYTYENEKLTLELIDSVVTTTTVVVKGANKSESNTTTYKTSIKSFEYSNSRWGTFSFDTQNIDNEDGKKYTLTGKGTVSMAGHDGSTTEYAFTDTVTIENGVTTMVIYMPDLMKGTKLTYKSGDAPEIWNYRGLYTGNTTATIAYGSLEYKNDSCTVKVNTDGTYNVTYTNSGSNFVATETFSSMTGFGTFSMEDIPVGYDSNGNLTFEYSGTTSIANMNSGAVSNYDYTCSGEIDTTNKVIKLSISLPTLMVKGTEITYESTNFTKQ